MKVNRTAKNAMGLILVFSMVLTSIPGLFFGVPVSEASPPAVVPSGFFPADTSGGLPLNVAAKVYFDQPILSVSGGPIMNAVYRQGDPGPLFSQPGSIVDGGMAVGFPPMNGLQPNTPYTVKIPGGQIRNGSGEVAGEIIWTFTTGGGDGGGALPPGDGGGPFSQGFAVEGSSVMGMTYVPTNLEFIGVKLRLSLPAQPGAVPQQVYGVDPSTVNESTVTLSVYEGAPYSPENLDVIFDPSHEAIVIAPMEPLIPSTEYELKVRGGPSGIRGFVLQNVSESVYLPGDYKVRFSTGSLVSDNVPPRVNGLEAKKDQSTGVIRIFFSEPLKASRAENPVYYAVYKRNSDGAWGSAALDLSGAEFHYDPMPRWVEIRGGGLNGLSVGDEVKVRVGPGVQDLAGNPIDTVGDANQAFGRVGEKFRDEMNSAGDFMQNTDMGQFAMMPVRAFPFNTLAGNTSDWMIQFPITQQLAVGDSVVLKFPAGFGLSGASIHATAPPNADINGPGPGQPILDSVAGVTYSEISQTVKVKIAGSATNPQDYLTFVLAGIQNSISGNATGFSVSISTQNAANETRETLYAEPFTLTVPGAGANTLNVRVLSGVEPVAGVEVWMGSPVTGKTSSASNSSGLASFANLPDGYYMIWTEPTISVGAATYLGNPMPQQVQLRGGGTQTIDHLIQNAGSLPTITVTVYGGPSGKEADVFAGSPTGFVKKEVTFGGSGTDVYQLKVKPGTYHVGVGPRLPEGPTAGPPPATDWVPPMPKPVTVTSGNAEVAFNLTSASLTLTVYVRDGQGGAIQNAPVWAYDPKGGGMGAHGQTDTQGKATLKVGDGALTVGTMVPGMPPLPEQNVAMNGANKTVNFVAVKPSLTISGVVRRGSSAVPGASVFAYQVDAAGNPIPGHAGAMSSSSGSFTLFVNPNTRWKIGAFIPNYGQVMYDGAADGSTDGVLEVANSNIANVNLTADEANAGTVSGTVTVGGQPVQGAGVWAEPLDRSRGMGNGTTSGQDGAYVLTLVYGSYRLHAWVPEVGELEPVDITLNSGNSSLTRDFSLQTGTLTINFSSGVTEAFVRAHNSLGRGNEIRINGSDPVTQLTMKLPRSSQPYRVSAFVPGFGRLPEQSVVVSDADPNPSISFNIGTSTYTVTARFIDAATTGPIKGVAVSLTDKVYGATFTKISGADGRISFSLKGGNYFLSMNALGYLVDPPQMVDIFANEDVGDVPLTPAGSGVQITGTVYRNGLPTSNDAKVWATTPDGGWAGAPVDASGNFALNVKGGSAWTIEAASDGYQTAPDGKRVVQVAYSDVSGVRVDLTPRPNFTVKPPAAKNIVPASGGAVEDPNSGSKLIIPANALGSSADAGEVKIKQTTNVLSTAGAKPLGGVGMDFTATDNTGQAVTKFNSNVSIEVYYGDFVAGMSEAEIDKLQLGYWDDSSQAWITVPSVNDKVYRKLTAAVDHFTTFAPLQSTGIGAPATPTGLNATAAGSSQINLSWSSASGTSGYNLYRSASSGGTFTKINSSAITGTSYSDTGLSASTAYYYKVTAENASGESAASSAVSATTTAATTGGGGGGGGGGGTTTTTTSTDPVISGNQADISNSATSAKATNSDGGTTATTSVTADAVDKALAAASVKEVTLTVKESATEQVASIPADSFTKMSEKKADLVVKTEKANLTIPAEVVKVADLAAQLGVASNEVKIEVKVKEVPAAQAGDLTAKAAKADAALKPVAKVLSFNLQATAAGKTVTITSFGDKVVKGEFPYTAGDVPGVKNLNKLNVYKYDEAKGEWVYVRSRPDPNGNKVVFYTGTFSNYAIMEHSKSFGDIVSHWAKDDVELMASKYIVTGDPSGAFVPERGVTRAEFAAMLARAVGLSPFTGTQGQFTDVASTAWYYGIVEAAARAGLVNGYGNGKFGPNDLVTREQVASMVVRSLKKDGKGATLTSEQATALLVTFDDQVKVSAWATGDLAAAVNEKIVTGKAAKTLEPGSGASRAEAAVMIARYWKK